jgi:hypothetical protein
MNPIHRSRTLLLGVAALLAFAVLVPVTVAPARADDWWADERVPVPILIDVSATTESPALFTVAGAGFTPGGRVYLAIYDQMAAKLYETRWIVASPDPAVLAGPTDHQAAGSHGGTLREAFANLCGATAMMRALDEATATWSNWLTVEPACAAHPATGGSWDATSGYGALEAGRVAAANAASPSDADHFVS